jgi:metal-responsive CopG/Arc/MetJ family transcriptional regulator
MARIVVRLDDRLLAGVDGLVADGVAATRAEVVRLALVRLMDERRRARASEHIVAAYRRHPQTDEELAGIDAATHALVEDEPW